MIKFRIRILLLGNWRFELKIEWNLLFVFCFIKLSDTMGSMAQRFFFYLKNWNKIKYNLNDFMLCVLTYIPTSYTLLLYASVIRYFPYTAKRNSIQKKIYHRIFITYIFVQLWTLNQSIGCYKYQNMDFVIYDEGDIEVFILSVAPLTQINEIH